MNLKKALMADWSSSFCTWKRSSLRMKLGRLCCSWDSLFTLMFFSCLQCSFSKYTSIWTDSTPLRHLTCFLLNPMVQIMEIETSVCLKINVLLNPYPRVMLLMISYLQIPKPVGSINTLTLPSPGDTLRVQGVEKLHSSTGLQMHQWGRFLWQTVNSSASILHSRTLNTNTWK